MRPSTSQSSSSSASSSAPIAVDVTAKHQKIFYRAGSKKSFAKVEVGDSNSPSGKRETQLCCEEMIDVDGKKTVFEAWAKDAERISTYFRCLQKHFLGQ
jgi:hypothetical protein